MARYTQSFLAFVLLLLGACSDDAAIVDSTPSESAILFTDMRLSHYTVDTDTVDVRPGQDKSADDAITIPFDIHVAVSNGNRVGALRYEIREDGKSAVLGQGVLTASGSRDSWTATVAFARKRGDVGDYRIDVSGTDDAGLASNSAQAKLRVLFGSKPPEIVAVFAPDTVELQPETVVLTISAEVRDPSGAADIKQVFFRSFLPDGRPGNNGRPIDMFDDGQPGNGDAVAGDGIYSRKVQMPPDTPTGDFRFEFRALDFSGLSSNTVVHKLTVR